MWRRAVGLGFLTLACAAVGLASTLSLASDSLGASSISVPRCTAAGLSVLQNLTVGNVVSVEPSPPAQTARSPHVGTSLRCLPSSFPSGVTTTLVL